jgi:hypothetical protein
MVAEEKVVQFQPVVETPADAADIGRLFEPDLDDPITETQILNIPIGKPKTFFRTHPDKLYRRRTMVYVHQPEGVVEKQHFIVDPVMQNLMAEEARFCNLILTVDRAGSPRFWPIPVPRDGEHDMACWSTAREVARQGIDQWVRPVWMKRAYVAKPAQPGYAPDPDWSKLPSYEDMIRRAVGEAGIIRDEDHAVYKDLCGAKPDGGNALD